MELDNAIRMTEILLGFAFVQQSMEHLKSATNERALFIPRLILSLLLIIGFQTIWVSLLLLLIGLANLIRFQGPYNGGADRMSLLILCCLCLVNFAPTHSFKKASASFSVLNFSGNSALSFTLPGSINSALTLKEGSALNAFTSLSRSTINLTATD